MAYRSHTTATGCFVTNGVVVNVPAGVQIGDIVVLTIAQDNMSGTMHNYWPSGFVALDNGSVGGDGQSACLAYKRLTAVDSGTYSLGTAMQGGRWCIAAIAFSGRHGTTNPTSTENLMNGQDYSSGFTAVGTGLTATAGADLLWMCAPDFGVQYPVGGATGQWPGSYGIGTPANFTERADFETNTGVSGDSGWAQLALSTRDNVSAGATGDITATVTWDQSGTCRNMVYVVHLPAADESVNLSVGPFSWTTTF